MSSYNKSSLTQFLYYGQLRNWLQEAAQQLRSGEALFGKDGALAPLLERILTQLSKVRWTLI